MSSIPGNRRVFTLGRVRGVLAAVLVLCVPVVAVCALLTRTGPPAVAVAPADDAGLRLLEANRQVGPAPSGPNQKPAVILRNWTQTTGPTVSGGKS